MESGTTGDHFSTRTKSKDVRASNMIAAKAVADSVRTSLGPRGMDKMVVSANGDVVITNDGATILREFKVVHPAAKMFVELSKSQDVEAGDGTTSVVVMAGSMLAACERLLAMGIHPTSISEGIQIAAAKSEEILESIGIPLTLNDRDSLLRAATTSLSSKVVSQNSALLSPIAVDAVMTVIDPKVATNVDLRDIRVVKKLGGTIEDTELVKGIVFTQKSSHSAGGPSRVKNAKIGLIQFCLSAPKTDMENQIVVTEYSQMDRILREERAYILNMCKKIAKSGCNVLLIQKSILRDAVTDLSLHFLAKLKIMVVKDIERDEVEFVHKILGCTPITSIDDFTADRLGSAGLVEEVKTTEGRLIKMTECNSNQAANGLQPTVTILCRASNKLVLDETERSIHDALCVIRSLVKKKYLVAGGSSPEMAISVKLQEWAKTLTGTEAYVVRAFAESLEVIPVTLAENAGLNPISVLTELRNLHASGKNRMGINVKKGQISDMNEEGVVQPMLVTLSALTLAAECVRLILKIDDIVGTR